MYTSVCCLTTAAVMGWIVSFDYVIVNFAQNWVCSCFVV